MTTGPKPVLLMVQALDAGGSERQLTEIARTLDRSRFEPHVACLREGGMRLRDLQNAGVPVLSLRVPSFTSMAALKAVRTLGRYVRAHNVRLVHTFDPPANLFGVAAARFLHVPVVLSSQRSFRSLRNARRRLLMRFTDRLVDGVVVNCLALKDALVREDRVSPSRIHLCYNGVDLERFHPSPRPASSCPTLAYIGVLRPEKGVGTLLEAVRQLPPAPGLHLRIVGAGSMAAALQQQCAASRLKGVCSFEPPISRVEEALRDVDIFVLPSLSEACSNALMEAMASGCAVVASNVGGNPELVRHGETGMLFEPGNAASLSAVLQSLIAGATLRERLGRNAAAAMRARFGLAQAAAAMGRIYDSFL